MPDTRIVVLGLGNLLLMDEGAGVHVVKRLAEENLPDHVELIDGGTAPLQALNDVTGIARLFVIDALDAEIEAGAVYGLGSNNIAETGPCSLSLHEANLKNAVDLWKQWGLSEDRITVIGIAPEVVDWGTELSATLRDRLDHIVDTIADGVRAACSRQHSCQ